MSNAERIARAFGKAHKSTNGWQCLCPCHEDNNPSLGVTDKEDGSVVFNCLANCDWREIQRVAEDRGLIEKFELKKGNMENVTAHQQKQKAIIYTYYDETENEKYQKVRILPKTFLINRIENNQILKGLNGQKVPLYNLPAVLKSDIIYITEGEKDADSLIKNNLCATTNIAGGAHWDDSFTEALKNKTIIICQDNDDTGRKRTAKIKSILVGKVKEILLFAPETLPEKGDVTDWLESGGNAEDIIKLSTLIYKLPEKLKALNLSEWLEQPAVEAIPILPNLFDAGDKVVIIGQSKTRKSFFTQQLAFCLSTGRNFLEFQALPKKRVLIIQFEIKKDRYHIRCLKMAQRLSLKSEDFDCLQILNARGINPLNLEQIIKEQVELLKPEVVIIDPLYKLITGDESKSEDIKIILSFFDKLAEDSGAAIIYVHHDKKGLTGDQQLTDRGSGSGVLARDFDSAIFLSPQKDQEDTLVIEFIARNYPPVKPFCIEWRDYGFGSSNAPIEKQTARNQANKKAKIDDLMSVASKIISDEMAYNRVEIPVSVFLAKLESAGMSVRNARMIKEKLIAEGLVELFKNKAEKGSHSKILRLLKIPEAEVKPEETEFGSSFKEEEDYLF